KFYFTPGDMGFHPIDTSVGRLGVLVCWDQWYPEGARLMALAGAELLLYPTAIGWDPDDDQAEKDRQRNAWILSHRGHAVANGPAASRRPGAARGWTSGVPAACWARRASSWPKPPPTRPRCCWPRSTSSAASTCAGSGHSCATAASMPTGTW